MKKAEEKKRQEKKKKKKKKEEERTLQLISRRHHKTGASSTARRPKSISQQFPTKDPNCRLSLSFACTPTVGGACLTPSPDGLKL